MSEKPHIRTLLDGQHVKGSETLHKSALQYFCHISWSLWKKISSKNSVFVVCEILRLFVNILTPDDKYSLSVKASFYCNIFKCNYLQTKKYFLDFFLNFWNLYKNWILRAKHEPQRLFASEIIDCKMWVYWNTQKVSF